MTLAQSADNSRESCTTCQNGVVRGPNSVQDHTSVSQQYDRKSLSTVHSARASARSEASCPSNVGFRAMIATSTPTKVPTASRMAARRDCTHAHPCEMRHAKEAIWDSKCAVRIQLFIEFRRDVVRALCCVEVVAFADSDCGCERSLSWTVLVSSIGALVARDIEVRLDRFDCYGFSKTRFEPSRGPASTWRSSKNEAVRMRRSGLGNQ